MEQEDFYFLKAEARSSATSQERLREIYNLNDPKFDALLSSNSNCPQDIIKKLYDRHEELFVRNNIARNPNTPEEIFFDLVRSPSVSTVNSILSNPSCPREVLHICITKTPAHSWIYNLLRHKNATKKTVMLALNHHVFLRPHIMNKKNYPREIQRYIYLKYYI